MKDIKILDTTLRDGGYVINFSFTSDDTSTICKKLEEAGIEYIEIGHGTGFNSSNMGYVRAAQSDEEYMIAADQVLKKSKYGMFCIPGIARLEDLDTARKHNMDFIRVGTDVTRVEESKEFIKKGKENGMFVAANYMKSYALEPKKFAENVLLSEKYGVDVIYVVDSAGGMFQDDIGRYFDEIRKVSEIPIGFHGHDNLGLSISNSLSAAEMGFEFIDSSLQGLGRSSGNACTEILVAALKKRGFNLEIDHLKLLDLGYEYVQPLITSTGKNPLDIAAGYSDFHSSYMHHILKYSFKYNVDPIQLIIEMAKVDKINFDIETLDKIAQKQKSSSINYEKKYSSSKYAGGEQDQKHK